MRLEFIPGYHIEFYQLSRIVDLCLKNNIRNKIPSTLFIDDLGLQKNQFGFFARALSAFGVIKSHSFILTKFGYMVAINDSFFEDLKTLCICHYNISSNPDNYVWYRFINSILPKIENNVHSDFTEYYTDVSELVSGKSAKKKVSKEISSILDIYTNQNFKKLKLFFKDYENYYQKDDGVELDHIVFLYLLLVFKDNLEINATALTIEEIIHTERSPARVFHLDRYKVNDLLNKLHSQQLISLENFGDLDQVRFNQNIDKNILLKKIYNKD
ncbi:MAG: DUF4007 family protein [Ignavibacteriales bacterium]|nr:DUF4007 family protein [Bdellovibrionales bacterium]MCB9211067.1 DUF4007 family protein [Ignavibacteriales bacterium]